MGEGLLTLYHQKVKKEWKIAFVAAVLLGLLIHIYKFTNTLPNHDSLYNYYSDQNVIGSGRWLLSLACGISSYFDLPWVTGILSIFWIAIAAVLVVDTLEIRNPVLLVLSSGLIVAFPGVTETLFFGFTADGYFLAMALSALAVWLTRMEVINWKRAGLAMVCICCACGIYQSYVSFAMVLALCHFMLVLLENRYPMKRVLRWVWMQLAMYAVALGLYYVLWKVLMAVEGYSVNSYQGIDRLALSLDTVLSAIPSAIAGMLLLFLEWNPLEHGWTLYANLNVVFLLAAVGILVYCVLRTKMYRDKLRFVLFVGAGGGNSLCGFPVAVCVSRRGIPAYDAHLLHSDLFDGGGSV